MARGKRRGDNALDQEVRVLHRLGEIAHRRAVSQHHVDIDPEPLGMKPARIGDAMRPVERVMRRLGMEHGAAVGLDHVLRLDQQRLDILVLDPPSADLDIDRHDIAAEPGSGAGDPHRAHRGARALFRALDRIADREARGFHIGDIAALDPGAGAVAAAQHLQFAGLGLAHDHRRDAERADIDRAKGARKAALRGGARGHQSDPPAAATTCGAGPPSSGKRI